MIYALTYTDNVQTLTARGIELCLQGKYSQYMHTVSLDDDNDGVPDRIALTMAKVNTAYSADFPANLASLCLIKLPIRDIIGDSEESYTGFCDDMNLTVLACGENVYQQVQDDPAMLALYRNVLPDVEVTDSDHVGTGEYRFNHWIEFDAPVRS